ncbi:DUF4349 domain-containing protein [Streptomyces sp. NPDC048577]|uniref:DUF4349 domain-containing protein n=1 Tax=Streptomyces sp. NPDC048577 TaxID=3157209 RepID=UPI00343BD318
MRGTRTTAAVLLAAALALTGCGASDSGTGRSSSDAKAGPAAGREAADDAAAKGPEAGRSTTAVPGRQVIRTAELHVEVDDAVKALTTVRRVTATAGGHVAQESTERSDGGGMGSRVVLRVPQERYEPVVAELAGIGTLVSRSAEAKDVTEQVVDVESRIATQRTSVARVRGLMERATQLSDVVALEGELSRRQADLESLLAQRSALKDQTSLGTITLVLAEKEKPRAVAEEGDGRPGFLDALSGGWNALLSVLAWVGVVLAAVAPWLVVALVVFLVWRRLRRMPGARRAPGPDAGSAAPAARDAEGAPVPAAAADPAGEATGTGAPPAPRKG